MLAGHLPYATTDTNGIGTRATSHSRKLLHSTPLASTIFLLQVSKMLTIFAVTDGHVVPVDHNPT
jgi:hypothetical protein